MSSKFNRFVDREHLPDEDISIVVDDKAVQVDVYRAGTTGTRPGFDDEVGDYAKIASIRARIDKWNGKDFSEIISDAGEAIEIWYVGLTLSTDINDKDEWRLNDLRYEVVAFDELYTEGRATSILLRRKV